MRAIFTALAIALAASMTLTLALLKAGLFVTTDIPLGGLGGPLCFKAGGLLSPLWKRTTNLEFLASLGATPVLVARSALGTINHTLLSLAALRLLGRGEQ